MTLTVLVLGDELAELTHLATACAPENTLTSCVASPARGLVVGVDLSTATTVRRAKTLLRERVQNSLALMRRHPEAVHLLIACRTPPGIPCEEIVAASSAVALRAHAALELDARYVDVTVLDVAGCDDRAVLADRILDRIAGEADAYASVGLTWRDIRHTAIVCAAEAQYL